MCVIDNHDPHPNHCLIKVCLFWDISRYINTGGARGRDRGKLYSPFPSGENNWYITIYQLVGGIGAKERVRSSKFSLSHQMERKKGFFSPFPCASLLGGTSKPLGAERVNLSQRRGCWWGKGLSSIQPKPLLEGLSWVYRKSWRNVKAIASSKYRQQ
jgi:hypothetical protein